MLRLCRSDTSVMYRTSLTRLVRCASAVGGCSFRNMCLPPLAVSYVRLPLSTTCDSARRYFSNSVLYTTTSHTASRPEEATLNEVILAMKNVPELLETYKNFQGAAPMVQRNRVTLLYSLSNIIQKDERQRVHLNGGEGTEGDNSLFLDLAHQILEHISECSDRDLASIMWSLGKLGAPSGRKRALAKACERQILSRDITTFDVLAINQILTGLAALKEKKSQLWTETHSSVLSGEIQISYFDNQALVGVLWGFLNTGNGSQEFFQLFREEIYSRGMSTFDGTQLSQLVFTFARKGIEANKLYSHVEQQVLQVGLNGFCNMKVFLVLWAFANCRSGRSYKQLFSQIDRELVSHGVEGFKNSDLSHIVWCFSKVGAYNAKVYDVIKEEVLVRGLDTFHRYLLQLLWSFAKAKKGYADFNEKVAWEFLSTGVKRTEKKVLCEYAWCFRKLGITDERVYQAIETALLHRNMPHLKHLHIRQLLSGFAHAKKGSKEFLEFLETVTLRLNFSTLKAAEICNILWSFAEMEHKTSQLFDVVEKEILHRGKSRFTSNELRSMKQSYEVFSQGSKELMELLN